MAEYASNAKANAGLTTGIIGTSLGALASGILGNGNGGGINLFGNNNNCPDNMPINRYEANLMRENDQLRTQVALRDANTYTDQKLLDLYRNIDSRFAGVEAQLCQQNVVNAQVTASLSCMQANIATLMSLTKTVIPIDSICPTPAVATTAAG